MVIIDNINVIMCYFYLQSIIIIETKLQYSYPTSYDCSKGNFKREKIIYYLRISSLGVNWNSWPVGCGWLSVQKHEFVKFPQMTEQ